MNKIWNLNLDEYLEILQIAKNKGIKPGESIEEVLVEYMENKGRKPLGHTELTKEEFLKSQQEYGNNILDIEVDKNGKQKINFIKGKES